MLIQPNRSRPWASAVATRRRSAVVAPNPTPFSIITRQSSAVWFQPASAESASASNMSATVRARRTRSSEDAIADFEMRVLAEAGHGAGDPIRDPADHAVERHDRIAEQARRLRRVDQPGRLGLAADEDRFLAEAPAE